MFRAALALLCVLAPASVAAVVEPTQDVVIEIVPITFGTPTYVQGVPFYDNSVGFQAVRRGAPSGGVIAQGDRTFRMERGELESGKIRETRDRRAAVEELVARITRAGWQPAGRGGEWYSFRFRWTGGRPPAVEAPTRSRSEPAESRVERLAARALVDVRMELFRAMKSGNAAAAAALYAADAVIAVENGPEFRGRDAIREFYRGRAGHVRIHDVTVSIRSLRFDGDAALEEGTRTVIWDAPDQRMQTEVGQYTMVWARQPDGAWRIRLETVR